MSAGPLCPTCKKAVKPRSENPGFPFCSTRCRQVDLGKWLNEEFRVPAEDADDDVNAEPVPQGEDPGRDRGNLH